MFTGSLWPAEALTVAEHVGGNPVLGCYAWPERVDAVMHASRCLGFNATGWGQRTRMGTRFDLWVLGQVALIGPVVTNRRPQDGPRPESVEIFSPVAYPISLESFAPKSHSGGAEILARLRARYLPYSPTTDEVDAALADHSRMVTVQSMTPLAAAIPDLQRLLAAARSTSADRSPIHGDQHWRCVAWNAALLTKRGVPANPAVLLAFAVLHDSRRVSDGVDPGHGPRAATLANELRDVGDLRLSPEEHEQLVEALTIHTGSPPVTDATIGACLDADRLDLVRLGRPIDPSQLSTQPAIDQVVRRTGLFGIVLDLKPRPVKPPDWGYLWLSLGGARGLGDALRGTLTTVMQHQVHLDGRGQILYDNALPADSA